MKWLIIGDTHGMTHELAELKRRYRDEVEAMFHCGDSELRADRPEIAGFMTVEGNCDFPGAYPPERVERSGPLKFLIVHGHLLGVRRSRAGLLKRAAEEQADIVCFGHTHLAGSFQENGTVVINPGSLRLPRNYAEGTYVLLELDARGGFLHVNYYNLAGKPVDHFSKTYIWKKSK